LFVSCDEPWVRVDRPRFRFLFKPGANGDGVFS